MEDYRGACAAAGVEWEVEGVRSADGVEVRVVVGGAVVGEGEGGDGRGGRRRNVVVVYFQGYVFISFHFISTCVCVVCVLGVMDSYLLLTFGNI